ncbi:helix-turn-helix domain-containing protein [Halostagnicola sp. A-GB9-2]|uniref:helix-turn-helix transcriptional regulator n=1 Tax=Halostagnicola sp. A-GB9-2 TaxID=3048066 RepID=UPI0024BFC781|nr:helix-turn-helix domain-containing protein [Halostagnicola sp. A-GB9-2]MDJ1431838.1 winged helix-turn-helix transcriptional regulator [Halostagnicola sp. A-GB9-2]
MTSIDSAETVPGSISQFGDVPDVSTVHVPEIIEISAGPPLLIQMIRTVSDLEAALIVILFLMITALVGIRVTEAMSDRELSVPTQALASDEQRESVPQNETTPREQPPAYESVVSAETPPELLSDEGQVVRLLVENHGRIRQHQIAEETGWSKSKVSRTLSKMHDSGTIEKTSLGRENVITLARDEINENNQSDSDNVGNPVA